MDSDRPDPNVLLRRIQEDAARAGRGQLRIFFGFAPGVGKTYRMLQVAHDLATQHGLDVVIGIVETHGRAETEALIAGLPALPRKRMAYRGHTLEELDLDAALARKPKLLLLDELAHSNVPGSRHAKRWQDALELLDAGVDVLTTVNVQHLESLNDVITQITGIQVRETVPDHVIDHAAVVELVDISPEELLSRLSEGKVYMPAQAERALEHFFQRGNLLALRELALRRTAQHVDEDVLEYRETHGVTTTWPAGERILVGVGPAPSSGRLIRAAARMAAGLRCPWVAAYVESSTLSMSEADRERLEAHLRIVEVLGGSVTRLSGARIADALLAYARHSNVTRIVIGKPTHSLIRDRVRGSLLDTIVRGSGEIDVHVISGDGTPSAPVVDSSVEKTAPVPRHYVMSGLAVGLTLLVALAWRALFDLPDPEMLFLLAVMLTAIGYGRGPSLMAAGLSVALFDFFFVPPFYAFEVADRRYVLTFGVFFGISMLLSELANRLKRQERDAIAREERTAVLYTLSRDLASAELPAEIARIAARHAAGIFAARSAVLTFDAEGALRVIGASPQELTLETKDLTVAKWALEHTELAGLGTDTLPGSSCVCAPLRVASAVAVLALWPAQPVPLRAEQRAFLDLFGRQVAVALERVRFASEARAAALRARTEEMRSSLLSAVSHDLRTPLASITGAATSLRDDAQLSAATRVELVDAICEEAVRLERLVTNLLDMTRLDAGSVALKRDWVPLDEIVSSALSRLDDKLAARPVRVRLAEDVPLVHVDPVLFEQLFVNLLENIAKYTPADTAVEIRAQRAEGSVIIEVADCGPGLPIGSEERVFDKFYRVAHTGQPGAGLGLAICRGIAEAHGGSIVAQPGAGAVFRVTLPSVGEPPL